MSGNSFGNYFKITTFGESHGPAIGVTIDGCPAQIPISEEIINQVLSRRKPGQSAIASPRKESDECKIISGVFNGLTTGTPLTILIENNNQQSKDYEPLKEVYRPGHADFVYQQKYGIRDHRGGGRSSARETAARVAAGVVANQILKKYQVEIYAYVFSIGEVRLPLELRTVYPSDAIDQFITRIPDAVYNEKAIQYLNTLKEQGDSCGGAIICFVKNCHIGLGNPVFDKLNAVLAHAMFSINAVKGFEIGQGLHSSTMKGSEYNDSLESFDDQQTQYHSNNEGGITGGLSNGNTIYFSTYFKPVSSIKQTQSTINTSNQPIDINVEGRHDPCVVPRAVPIIEAMTALVLADAILSAKNDHV
jgi:chorismate synthase